MRSRQVPWSHMRLAKEHIDHSVRMALANLANLGGGVAVAGPDLAQIFARHAVETVKRLGMIAGGDQQFVERRPVVSPIEVESDPLAEFVLVNVAAPPFVENMLIASKDGFNAKDDWPITREGALLDQRCGITLRGRQRVVVADQDHVGRTQGALNFLLGIENRIVVAECLVELAKISATVVRILGADFALHSRQRVQLGCTAAGSQIGG